MKNGEPEWLPVCWSNAILNGIQETEFMKCAIFLADGFETCEALITVDMLRRAKIETDTVAIGDDLQVVSSHNIRIEADRKMSGIDFDAYDVLILPGGKAGTMHLEACGPLKEKIRSHWEAGKLTCAICAAPSIFGHMHMLEGKKYTCHPDFYDPAYGGDYQMELAVTDGNLITGRGMGATIEFARHILKCIADEETLKNVEKGMQYEHSFRTLQ